MRILPWEHQDCDVSLYVLPVILQGIAAGIRTSHFLRACFSFFELQVHQHLQEQGFLEHWFRACVLLLGLVGSRVRCGCYSIIKSKVVHTCKTHASLCTGTSDLLACLLACLLFSTHPPRTFWGTNGKKQTTKKNKTRTPILWQQKVQNKK